MKFYDKKLLFDHFDQFVIVDWRKQIANQVCKGLGKREQQFFKFNCKKS